MGIAPEILNFCPRIKSPRFYYPIFAPENLIFAPEILGNSDFAPHFCP